MGTCGFPTARSRYYSLLPAVELQETFYDLPSGERMRELRQEAPSEFTFTVKVFQGLTHGSDSPTWRRMRRTKLMGDLSNYGLLRPTRENLNLWDEFLRLIKPLNPAFYVFQTPPSMRVTEGNARDIIDFFKSLGEEGKIGWEPRGLSYENPDLVKRILDESGVVHIVDPFRRSPLVNRGIAYFRLHGIGKGEVNYGYRYSDSDLENLRSMVLNQGASLVFVMFNNISMLNDSLRFKRLMEDMGK